MATPTELAREALQKVEYVQLGVDSFRRELEKLELVLLRERVKLLEEQVVRLLKKADEADQLRQLVAVLEDRVAELKKAKDEADKRQWQFVYIFAGAVASLLATVVVQLVLAAVRK